MTPVWLNAPSIGHGCALARTGAWVARRTTSIYSQGLVKLPYPFRVSCGLSNLVAPPGAFWPCLVACSGILGACRALLGPSWELLGTCWKRVGASWAHSEPPGASWSMSGHMASSAHRGPPGHSCGSPCLSSGRNIQHTLADIQAPKKHTETGPNSGRDFGHQTEHPLWVLKMLPKNAPRF